MTAFTTSGLNYPVNSSSAIRRVKNSTNPVSSENSLKNFDLGDEWTNTESGAIWKVTATNNGKEWVLIGGSGGTTPIDAIQVDTSSGSGTNPVLPNGSGLVTLTGQQVPSATIGSNVLRTDSTSASTINIQIQQSGSSASADTTLNGASHFNSSQFSVTNGFVSLTGGGLAIDSVISDSGTVTPDGSGNISLLGQSTPNTSGVRFTGSGSTLSGTMFSPFVGDFAFTTASAGSTRTLTASNTDNSSGTSNAVVQSTVGGTASGDPFFRTSVGSARSYAFGVDNSGTQALVMNTDSNGVVTPSSGTQVWNMSTEGHRTLPRQPTCSVYLTTTQPNVTGDGTAYTVLFDGEIFDIGNNYDPATGIYTFAHTGVYEICAALVTNNFTSSHTSGDAQFIFTGGAFASQPIYYCNPANVRRDPTGINDMMLGNTFIKQFTAGQTMKVVLSVNNGTKVVGAVGDNTGNPRSVMAVYLLG